MPGLVAVDSPPRDGLSRSHDLEEFVVKHGQGRPPESRRPGPDLIICSRVRGYA
jgi:hypothetical protein